MPYMADFLSKTTEVMPKEALDDALDGLRVRGSLLLHETYAPPWMIEIPPQRELADLLGIAGNDRVVPFHIVRRGRFDLAVDDEPTRSIETHQVAICASGRQHCMQHGTADAAVRIDKLLSGEASLRANPDRTFATELICGVFVLGATPLNPLLNALPSVLTLDVASPDADPILRQTTELLAAELARLRGATRSYTAERLLEIFFAEAVRSFAVTSDRNWFRGLNDPKIARALAVIHTNPGQAWTVNELATHVNLSPSRFAARFRDCLGETAIAYSKRRRIARACELLADAQSIDAVAASVGYSNAASFTRAFRELVGTTPARWSRNARSV